MASLFLAGQIGAGLLSRRSTDACISTTRTVRILAAFEEWGSDLAAACSGTRILATGAGDRESRIRSRCMNCRIALPVRVSDPLEFPGPVTALRPTPRGDPRIFRQEGMKHTALRWIAGVSALLLTGDGGSAASPLRRRAACRNARAATLDPTEAARASLLAGAVFETLVRLDDHGDPQPWLATAWTHDASRKRWVFTPRANVTLHNGAVWTAWADRSRRRQADRTNSARDVASRRMRW